MPTSIGATERQINLLGALLKAAVPISWQEVSRIEGYCDEATSVRSRQKRFERDLKSLEEAGLSVERSYDGLRPYYQLNRSACLLPSLNLTPDQRMLLYRIGLAYVDGGVAGPLQSHLSAALMKLQAGAGGESLPAVLPQSFVKRTLNRRPGEAAKLSAIGEALLERRRVRFRYHGRNEKTEVREVCPYALVSRRGGWYLLGLDEARAAVRTFRLTRIRGNITVAGRGQAPDYEIPPGYDPESSFASAPFSSGKHAFENVRIQFDADVAFIVENEFEGQYTIERRKDGSLLLHLPHAYPGELFSYLGEFPGHWRILGPAPLRKLVVSRLQAALARLERRRS